ncbi:pilus assembly protein TadG-related protein [Bradyrhizobium sp. SSUT112]|uniref:pilus assembly protein TadG-related protein n=1 Tax=Bradyrhizobium sp. SSUT112 TaxID=3040604 RepID=UPI0024478C35|nr:pilus assembly protein TadG-related protein [Bradyrhizobium sp. SSUT112]MDH2356858.1 pilus assembly protein TadG-related protein [Bradyrhizobium sp. SSUT112]
MLNMLRCRRGSAAFATVVALVPMIGAVALGGEAGSWYVTKQHAQNAADAAAYSGALTRACQLAGSCASDTVASRGKEFAARSAFCNTGDTSYSGSQCPTSFPTGISRAVQVASLTSWNGVNGNFVQATVSQQQPVYLAQLLGMSTVNIVATAVAQVKQLTPNPPCILALSGSLSFQGSPNINAQNCGLASNSRANNAINFTGGGMTFTGSLSAAGGCTGTATFCNKAFLHTPPVSNPFSSLDSALTTLCGGSPSLPAKCGLPVCSGSGLVAYTAATPCTNDSVSTKGNTAVTLTAGVYFISGALSLKGGSSITGTGVTFILLPGATFDTRGGGTLTLTGPTTAPSSSSLPTAFQSSASLLQYMSIYDASSAAVQFGGNSNINLTGTIYAPTAAVTFQGNPTISVGNGGSCGQLIAASVAFNGNATLDSSGCPTQQQVSTPPQYVQLVQ